MSIMSTVDWSTVIAMAIGVIIGAIATVVGQILYDLHIRPKILICDEAPPHSSEQTLRHRIIVKNEGASTAKACVGLLSIDTIKEDVVVTSKAFIDSPKNHCPITDEGLCWSFNIEGREKSINPHYLSIFPNTQKLLELYHVEKEGEELYIEIPSELGWETIRVKLKAREYKGTLKIEAENVKYNQQKHERKIKLVPNKEKGDVKLEFTDC